MIKNSVHNSDKRWWWGLISALLSAMILKIILLSTHVIPFNADEAVVGLMARHILLGERPIFFYGQAYMGSLDAWLISGGFALFGQRVWVIRVVQALLYCGTIYTTALIGKRIGGKWKTGIIAAWLMAIPTINVTLYTTASLGGYGEAMLIGNLILLTALRIATVSEKKTIGLWALWGFWIGLGFWAFGYTLVYTLPAFIWLIWRLLVDYSIRRFDKKYLVNNLSILFWVVVGVILGALPVVGFALSHGTTALFTELRGDAIAGVEHLSYWGQIGQHIWSLLVLGSTVIFGLRPPWDIIWMVLPLLPFAMVFWLGAISFGVQRSVKEYRKNSEWILILGVMICVLLGFIFTPFGADPSGRYFIVLMTPLALMAAEMVLWIQKRIGRWSLGLVVIILVYNLGATLQCATRNPPGITTQFYEISQIDHQYDQELIDFLKTHDETYGYANYWISYPLAFLSNEELIYIPRLPYHEDFRYTTRDDRYLPYDKIVDEAERVAYITSNHPALDQYLRKSFSGMQIAWQEEDIGDYHIFYALSQKVKPEQIGLGITR